MDQTTRVNLVRSLLKTEKKDKKVMDLVKANLVTEAHSLRVMCIFNFIRIISYIKMHNGFTYLI